MTAPVAHGYPDWTRQTPAADVLYYKQFGQAINATPTVLGPFFVGATPAVGIFARANGVGHQIQASFYADQAQSISLGQQTIDLARDGVTVRAAIRTLGPWMTLIVRSAGVPSTIDVTLWAAPTPGTWFSAHNDPSLIEIPGTVIGIGATVTVDAIQVHPGMAHLYLAQRVGTYNATLWSVDYLGNRRRVVSRAMLTGEFFSEMMPLMGGTAQIQVINTSGAASSVDATLTAAQNMVG